MSSERSNTMTLSFSKGRSINLIHEQMSNNTNVRTLIELLTKEARVKDLTKETSKLNITQRGYTYLSFS